MAPPSPQALLRLYTFVAYGVMGLYLPYFPSWLKAHGFVGFEMSALVLLLPLCQLAAPSLVGMLADRWGLRGRMITVCATMTALGLTSLATAATHFEHVPFAVAFVCMLAFASLRSPTVGLADVLAMEISRNYGRMRLWGSMGFMSMAYVGGKIVDTSHQFQLPVLIAVGLWILVLVSWMLPRTSALPPRPALLDARELLGQSAYRQLLVTMVLVFGSMSAYDLVATMHLLDLGAPESYVGAFWSIATLFEVVLMFFSTRIVERVGPGKSLTFALVVAAGRWLFLAKATSLPLMLCLQPLHAITFALMWVSAIGVLKRELGEKGTATAHGLFTSSNALGGCLGLATWGVVYDAHGGRTVFLWAAALVALGALSAARLIRLAPAEPRARAVVLK